MGPQGRKALTLPPRCAMERGCPFCETKAKDLLATAVIHSPLSYGAVDAHSPSGINVSILWMGRTWSASDLLPVLPSTLLTAGSLSFSRTLLIPVNSLTPGLSGLNLVSSSTTGSLSSSASSQPPQTSLIVTMFRCSCPIWNISDSIREADDLADSLVAL